MMWLTKMSFFSSFVYFLNSLFSCFCLCRVPRPSLGSSFRSFLCLLRPVSSSTTFIICLLSCCNFPFFSLHSYYANQILIAHPKSISQIFLYKLLGYSSSPRNEHPMFLYALTHYQIFSFPQNVPISFTTLLCFLWSWSLPSTPVALHSQP